MNYRYLTQGGPEQFKRDTSKRFTRRKNKHLLAIDDALTTWLEARSHDGDAETEALVAIVEAANRWFQGKNDKLATDSSFRMRHVALVQEEARDCIIQMKHRKKAQLKRIQDYQEVLKAQKERQAAEAAAKKQHLQNAKQELLRLANTMPRPGVPARELQANNQLEAQDPQHHAGHLLQTHFKDWKKSKSELSFWDYLKTLDPAARESLEKNQVEYLDDFIYRSLFEVIFDSSGRMTSAMTPRVQQMVLEKKPKQEVFAAAPIQLLDTTTWPSHALKGLSDGWAAVVLSTNDVLYAGVHTAGIFHHSSFLCGAPVKAACMLRVEKGEVTAVHEKNGHYQARTEDIMRLLAFLRVKMPQTKWFNVKYHPFNTNLPAVTAASMLNTGGGKPSLPPRQQAVA